MLFSRLWRNCLVAMCHPRTFYVLGAGTSFGLIPVAAEMGRSVEADFHNVGVYSTQPVPTTMVFERVLGTIQPGEEDIQKQLIAHMPVAALDFLSQKALYRPSDRIVPPQYALFEVVGAPATLFSFNLDGLAVRHCAHRHNVIEAHGHVDAHLFEHGDVETLVEATVVYGIDIPHRTFKIMARPEPFGILFTPPFAKAYRLLRLAPAVIVVGYSFAEFRDALDDAYAFDFLTSQLRVRPKSVFVISPNPQPLVDRLRHAIGSDSVFGLPLRWEVFAKTLLRFAHPLRGLEIATCFNSSEDMRRTYESELDVG